MGFISFLSFFDFGSLLMIEFRDDAFGFAFGAPLAIQASVKRGHDGNEFLHQVFFSVIHLVDDLDLSALHGQQAFQISESEAGQPVFVFDDDQRDGGVV
jgi:hypothetical protein